MKIAILSCFYPYRGGIAQFNANLYAELGRRHTVKAFNFKRQYPDILFPGRSQYVTEDDEAVPVESDALLDTACPLTWMKTVRAIRAWKPALVLMDYWMSWFAPSLGFVARRLKKDFRVVSILHNVLPHEPRFFDRPLTRYFLSGCTGHLVLSEEVGRDLRRMKAAARMAVLFHPIYTHFGEKIPRAEAERRLGLAPGKKNLLFFGLIREYKGLDLLIQAFDLLDEDFQLIIAGEPYGSFEKYRRLIEASRGRERIHCHLKYLRDSEVKTFFSAADLTVLPYRSATQSGISAVSYHFEIPLVVTDVGGLREAVEGAGTGLVAEKPEPEAIAEKISDFFSDECIRRQCRISIRGEKERLSWHHFGRLLEDFADTLNKPI